MPHATHRVSPPCPDSHVLTAIPVFLVAACSRSSGPPPSEVRSVITQRLRKLKAEFLAGDDHDIPPDFLNRMAGLDPNEVLSMVSNASVTGFFPGPFSYSGGPAWRGDFAAEVDVEGPMDVATAHFRVSGQATMTPRGLWGWKFLAFGPLTIRHVDGTQR